MKTAIPLWQREILDERLLDLEHSPGDELTRAEARAEMLLGRIASWFVCAEGHFST
jgi:hypothetical protein